MEIKIIYESKTGNTKLIAEAISAICEKNNQVSLKTVEEALDENDENKDVDLYFLGSWTDKGDCGEGMKKFCQSLKDKKMAIFGTSGFSGTTEYFKKLSDRFISHIPESNEILGSFYCQGKMPIGIRNRYESMLQDHPEDNNLEVSITNYDDAKTHPDKDDLKNAKSFAQSILTQIY